MHSASGPRYYLTNPGLRGKVREIKLSQWLDRMRAEASQRLRLNKPA
jgi:hypothetical protein